MDNKIKKILFIFLIIIILLVSFFVIKKIVDTNNKNEIEKLEKPDGGGAASLSYSTNIKVNKEKNIVELYYENNSKSRENASIELYIVTDEELLFAKSDIVSAGEKIETLEYSCDKMIETGNYNGILKVIFYDDETLEKQPIVAKVEVNVIVK